MPPKPKFTREEVIEAALMLVSQKGIEGLSARELGEVLGSSARPIFTLFKNMEELQEEVRRAAMQRFEKYAEELFSEEMPVFKQIGIKMVLFGAKEPKLYRLLFMQELQEESSFEDVYGTLGSVADACIEAIERDYQLSEEEAKFLFKNVWIYTFGVGAMCATRVCHFSMEQIGTMLSTAFQSVMLLIKSGKYKEL